MRRAWPARAGLGWPRPGWGVLLAVLAGVLLVGLPLLPAGGLVIGGAVLLLTLLQPWFGLALTLLAAPWGALEKIALGGSLPLDSGQLLLFLTVAAWLAHGVVRRRIMLRRTVLNLPLALFLLVAALSLLGAPSLTYGFRELLKWVEVALVMLIVVDLGAAERSRVRLMVGLVLLSGLSQALIGIWQFGLRGSGPEHFEILGGFYRAYGTFEQPNPYGGFMALTASLALGVLLGLLAANGPALRRWWRVGVRRQAADEGGEVVEGPRPGWFWLFFAAVCALACGTALLLSWSRGAWLGFGAGLAMMGLFWPRRRWQGVLLLVGGGLLLLLGLQSGLVPASVADRLVSFQEDARFEDVRGVDINDSNYAVLERLAHWQSALAMARAHPWLGVGFGNYEPAYASYALLNWPYPLGHAHNYYLNILAETGVLGLAAYLLLWSVTFGQTWWLLRRLAWPQRGVALGLLAAWTALTVHHLLDNLYVNNLYLHLGVMLGMLQLLARENESGVYSR